MKTPSALLIVSAIAISSAAIAQQGPRPPAPPPPQGQGPGQQQQPPPPTNGPTRAQRPQGPRVTVQQMAVNPLAPRFGDPLPGLPTALVRAFEEGRVDFTDRETVEGGLGPIFNRDSCVTCHGGPAPGGASPINVTRFGSNVGGVFDALERLGGSLLQERSISPLAREVVPTAANVVARRNSTALFGLGLIEAISDQTILAGVRQSPVDGVRGKAAMVTDVVSGQPRVGHFGWKGQQATILAFSADAYMNEMGVTNRFFPTENAPNGNAERLAQHDRVADPEDAIDPVTGKTDIDKVTDFMRLLAPPPVTTPSTTANLGRTVFNLVNCNLCHTPTLMSGPHSIPQLANKAVNLYSDLLLHDMGRLGDGIVQGNAGPRDMRTPPLWGVRASAPYLHDGRATTLDAAIRAHDGEAAGSRDRYLRLTPEQRTQVVAFLESL